MTCTNFQDLDDYECYVCHGTGYVTEYAYKDKGKWIVLEDSDDPCYLCTQEVNKDD